MGGHGFGNPRWPPRHPRPLLSPPSPCLSSPAFSVFLLRCLCRLEEPRAPAETCLQARPGLLSEWVSQGGEGPEGGRGALASSWNWCPWWPQPAQPWSRQVGGWLPLLLSPFSGLPWLQKLPSLPGPKRNGGQGWTLHPFLVRSPVMLLWLVAGTHHPKDP